MNNKAVINIQDPVRKTVGKRMPQSKISTALGTKAQARAWHRAMPCLMPPKGVYRFKSHEEADAWLMTNRTRNQ